MDRKSADNSGLEQKLLERGSHSGKKLVSECQDF